MKADTGVKKAVALRLRIILEQELKSYLTWKNNSFFSKCMTPTNIKHYEREMKKRVNALRIVIHMLDRNGETKQPGWYDVIPIQKEGPPKNEQAVPKTKQLRRFGQ
jgi:hypothetical protein